MQRGELAALLPGGRSLPVTFDGRKPASFQMGGATGPIGTGTRLLGMQKPTIIVNNHTPNPIEVSDVTEREKAGRSEIEFLIKSPVRQDIERGGEIMRTLQGRTGLRRAPKRR